MNRLEKQHYGEPLGRTFYTYLILYTYDTDHRRVSDKTKLPLDEVVNLVYGHAPLTPNNRAAALQLMQLVVIRTRKKFLRCKSRLDEMIQNQSGDVDKQQSEGL